MHIRFLALIYIFMLPLSIYAQNSDGSGDSDNGSNNPFSFSTDQKSFPVYKDPIGLQLGKRNANVIGSLSGDEYILGPQDVVSFQAKGLFNLFARGISINAQGFLYAPEVGKVKLDGLTLNQAESRIDSVLRDKFNDTQLAFFSLDFARPIAITSNGTFPIPNKKPIPGLTRLNDIANPDPETFRRYRALSGFDLRNIRIVRNGQTLSYDLVQYIMTGDLSQNPILQNGDHLEADIITSYTNVITISGAVQQEGKYTYRPGDTFGELLQLSGGFATNADTTEFKLVSENGEEQMITSDLRSTSLAPNDRIIVPTNERELNHLVKIDGYVETPGSYEIQLGETTVRDIITEAGGLKPEAFASGVFVQRGNMGTTQAINVNANLMTRTSNQVLEGFEYLKNESDISGNRLFTNLNDPDQSALVLQDGDRIVIPKDPKAVFVFGQVNTPGNFNYLDRYSVQDYIAMAGGTALAADEDRIFIIKAGSRSWYKPSETELQSGDYIYVDRVPYVDYANRQQIEAEETRLMLQQISIGLTAVSTALLLLNYFNN